ncbi:hypothetical protein N7526_006350 [Penicillium atrosanguineum]|nr:hypothetical protein N7526_006350 [Penicillium atrosanguineum]
MLSDVDLEYFIMLSSLNGIMGNDTIARHRSARGLPAIAIDLGIVRGVRYIAETDGVANRLKRMGFRAVDEEEVLHLIQDAILRLIRYATDSQILTGFSSYLSIDNANVFWAKDPKLSGVLYVAGIKSKTRSNRVHEAINLME